MMKLLYAIRTGVTLRVLLPTPRMRSFRRFLDLRRLLRNRLQKLAVCRRSQHADRESIDGHARSDQQERSRYPTAAQRIGNQQSAEDSRQAAARVDQSLSHAPVRVLGRVQTGARGSCTTASSRRASRVRPSARSGQGARLRKTEPGGVNPRRRADDLPFALDAIAIPHRNERPARHDQCDAERVREARRQAAVSLLTSHTSLMGAAL